eukprot:1422387-Pleurochrysis_carterae.AAC.2
MSLQWCADPSSSELSSRSFSTMMHAAASVLDAMPSSTRVLRARCTSKPHASRRRSRQAAVEVQHVLEVALALTEVGRALVGELLGERLLGVVAHDDNDVSVDAARWCCCGQSSGCQMPLALVQVKVVSCSGSSGRKMRSDEGSKGPKLSHPRTVSGCLRYTQRRHLGYVAAMYANNTAVESVAVLH